jgi:hypothetical protein
LGNDRCQAHIASHQPLSRISTYIAAFIPPLSGHFYVDIYTFPESYSCLVSEYEFYFIKIHPGKAELGALF